MITSEEIKRRLWNGANELRGSMDASRYKDYMLGLMFYKFLSDKTLEALRKTWDYQEETEEVLYQDYLTYYGTEDFSADYQEMTDYLGYPPLAPRNLYQTWIKDINSGEFELEKINNSLTEVERLLTQAVDKGRLDEKSSDFEGLLTGSALDLSDTALGSNLKERSNNIRSLILLFSDLNMVDLQKGDILGDAYEYLIGQFAMESGKKAGEFYTPRQVSEVMAQIVAKSKDIRTVYDPTVGSASLLLTLARHLDPESRKDLDYFGQEKNTATYNLTRMNLLLHGVRPDKMTIRNADTLAEDWPHEDRDDSGRQFDAVVMNPPYSIKNWNRDDLRVTDPRFEAVGILPPDSKGDFAFLLHGLYHLSIKGTMAIVLPHGVLFRGGAEGEIRKKLLEKNQIDTIIGLPSNLFTNTGIPVVVIILKKDRPMGEPVLIIDASKDFIKVKKQNVLEAKDIAKIVDTYEERREEPGYSYLASREVIQANDYNLNIPRYVENLDKDLAQDVDAHLYGGLPQHQIEALPILNHLLPDCLDKHLKPVRPGYKTFSQSWQALADDVLTHERVRQQVTDMERLSQDFLTTYWQKIKDLNASSDPHQLMEEMLVGIKELMGQFPDVNSYDAYQIMAEIWERDLTKDTEIIAGTGFYPAARSRTPHMVTKGTGAKKRLEQEGYVGVLIPSSLIEQVLMSDRLAAIAADKAKLDQVTEKLADWLERAKSEEDEELSILSDCLNDQQEAFDLKLVKARAKEDGSPVLQELLAAFAQKTNLTKTIKEAELALNKASQEAIPNLTDQEIDQLLFQKWFGQSQEALSALITQPIQKELDTLKVLSDRYADTLASLDRQIAEAEDRFNQLLNSLEVTQ